MRCPDGTVASCGSASEGGLSLAYSAPSDDGRGWQAAALEVAGQSGFSMYIHVICTTGTAQTLPAGGSGTAGASLSRVAAEHAKSAMLAARN